MNEEVAKLIFDKKLNGENIILSQNLTVPLVFFIGLFKNVSEITYDNLMESNADRYGYKQFFEECRSEGILN